MPHGLKLLPKLAVLLDHCLRLRGDLLKALLELVDVLLQSLDVPVLCGKLGLSVRMARKSELLDCTVGLIESALSLADDISQGRVFGLQVVTLSPEPADLLFVLGGPDPIL